MKVEKVVKNGFVAYDGATGEDKYFVRVNYFRGATTFLFLKPDKRTATGMKKAGLRKVNTRLRNDGAIRNAIKELLAEAV